MPTATTIVELCDAITAALRQCGFFDEHVDDDARHRAVHEAVEETSRELGLKLDLSEKAPGSGHTVLADDIPGVITIVAQRRVEPPPDAAARTPGADGVNPAFGVTWALA